MFEFVPILRGYYLNYTEYLWLLTILGVNFISLFFFFLAYICRKIGNKRTIDKKLRNHYVEMNNDGLDSMSSSSSVATTTSSSDPDAGRKENTKGQINTTLKKDGFLKASYFLSWVGWVFASYFLGNFSMYQLYVPLSLTIFFMMTVLSSKLIYQERIDRREIEGVLKSKDKDVRYSNELLKLRNFNRKIMVTIMSVSIILPVMWDGFCVNSFQDFGGIIFGTASLSSSIVRSFQMTDFCPVGPPCHLYATLPEDTSSAVFINAHTHEMYEQLDLQYDTDEYYQQSGELRNTAQTESFKLEKIERIGKRRMHSAYLSELQPGTLYHIKLYYNNEYLTEAKYKTLPDENSNEPIVIASGGDNGDTVLAYKMTQDLAQHNPDVILSGGDIAYDNGMCTCYFAWDFFFKPYEELNKKLGRLVPLVFAVGNHDVGVDHLSGRGVKVDAGGPLYMVYFPQHSRVVNNTVIGGVPPMEERKSYHYHKFGKMLLMALDSGLVSHYEGEQDDWMRGVLEEHKDFYKIADYHYPTYPACPNFNADEGSEYRVNLWNPLFDHYQFMTVFENHEHVFKKTFPIRNGMIDPKGTLFLGDGGWGTDGTSCNILQPGGVYDKLSVTEHFWLVEYNPSEGKIFYTPFDQDHNEIMSKFEQNLEDYEISSDSDNKF
jgi:hypothetical protein